MKNKLSKKLVVLLSIAFAFCLTISMLMTNLAFAATGDSFRMKDDIFFRKDGSGIRFFATMSEEDYNALTAQEAEFGMMIAPKEFVASVDSFKFGSMKAEGVDEILENDNYFKFDQCTPFLDAEDMDYDGNSAEYILVCTFNGITPNNLSRTFLARAYFKIGNDYSYTDNVTEKNVYEISSQFAASEEFATEPEAVRSFVNTNTSTVESVYTVVDAKVEKIGSGDILIDDKLDISAKIYKASDVEKENGLNSAVAINSITNKKGDALQNTAIQLVNNEYLAKETGIFTINYSVVGNASEKELTIKRPNVSLDLGAHIYSSSSHSAEYADFPRYPKDEFTRADFGYCLHNAMGNAIVLSASKLQDKDFVDGFINNIKTTLNISDDITVDTCLGTLLGDSLDKTALTTMFNNNYNVSNISDNQIQNWTISQLIVRGFSIPAKSFSIKYANPEYQNEAVSWLSLIADGKVYVKWIYGVEVPSDKTEAIISTTYTDDYGVPYQDSIRVKAVDLADNYMMPTFASEANNYAGMEADLFSSNEGATKSDVIVANLSNEVSLMINNVDLTNTADKDLIRFGVPNYETTSKIQRLRFRVFDANDSTNWVDFIYSIYNNGSADGISGFAMNTSTWNVDYGYGHITPRDTDDLDQDGDTAERIDAIAIMGSGLNTGAYSDRLYLKFGLNFTEAEYDRYMAGFSIVNDQVYYSYRINQSITDYPRGSRMQVSLLSKEIQEELLPEGKNVWTGFTKGTEDTSDDVKKVNIMVQILRGASNIDNSVGETIFIDTIGGSAVTSDNMTNIKYVVVS